MFVENYIDDLQVAHFKLQNDVLELQMQLQQLRNLPNKFDQAFGWVTQGFDAARNSLQQ